MKGGIGVYHQLPHAVFREEVYGNPDLKAISAVKYSLGAEQTLPAHIAIGVEGYMTDLRNLVVRSDRMIERQGEIVRERERLFSSLDEMEGITAYPSQANFILIRPEREAQSIFKKLVEQSILIRDVSSYPFLDNHLRISVGTPEENDLMVKELKSLLGDQ